MALDPAQGRRSISPPSSRRSSPAPRATTRAVEDGIYKADKALRRYGATIERALGSWEISPQEWADYIAFLGRLLKAIQNHPKEAPFLPHSDDVAYKLAQCLNPALPSGVHQKALEVYDYIFSTFGVYLSDHLHEFLPGLSAVLSFASLSVRPSLYSIFEEHIITLPPPDLRPMLKSLILSLLPALEEETSEDFERAFNILEKLEHRFSPLDSDDEEGADRDGYFWQCLFLAIITSPSRRQGALNFLVQKLPSFGSIGGTRTSGSNAASNGTIGKLSQVAELVVSPEPGLLVRCFVCGLSDSQLLIQRGFLDLLVTSIPLNSPLLLQRVGREDLDRLLSAAMHVLLRREMSLNRRLWSWFLGPDPKVNPSESDAASPTMEKKQSADGVEERQFQYFTAYGKESLERCVLAMFKHNALNATDKARPFRICLSLMDRWEIGGSIVPHMFLPAIESAYRYSLTASSTDTAEVMRSASLFFDGIESNLIWTNLIGLLRNSFSQNSRQENLQMFKWIIQHFNVKDEEMLVTHIPYATIYLLALLVDEQRSGSIGGRFIAIDAVSTLLDMIPPRAFGSRSSQPGLVGATQPRSSDAKSVRQVLDSFYHMSERSMTDKIPMDGRSVSNVMYKLSISLLLEALRAEAEAVFGHMVSVLLAINARAADPEVLRRENVFNSVLIALNDATAERRILEFPTISAILSLVSASGSTQRQQSFATTAEIIKLEPSLSAQIWHYLSPSAPKYHVEAVKAIWQLQDLVGSDDCVESSINTFIRRAEGLPTTCFERIDSISRFMVLWDHTIPIPASSAKYSPRGFTRRGSTMPSISDAKQAFRRQKVLTEPLMIVLDLLDDPETKCADVVKNWLHNLLTLENVFLIHFDLMSKFKGTIKDSQRPDRTLPNRLHEENVRQLDYILTHFQSILRDANEWNWQCLLEMTPPHVQHVDSKSGFVQLAENCCQFLCDDGQVDSGLEQKSVGILNTLLLAPSAAALKPLDLDSKLISLLMTRLAKNTSDLQGPLLILLTRSLRLRTIHEGSRSSTDARPTSSGSAKRASITVPRPSPNGSSTALSPTPPPQLPHLLQLGFTSPLCRPHLDQWVGFLSNILPVFADAIFTSLIPLVECLCTELDKAYNELVSIAKVGSEQKSVAPEATIMALLDALEMILSRAHDCLLDDRSVEPVSKGSTQSRGLLGNVAAGVFKAEGPPSKTAQANSRLTVVLAFQDTIRVSSKLWTWASHYASTVDFDKTSAATTSYNALRVRNRTRHLVEQMFTAEPLESLEVVIANWWHSREPNQATAALDLLHVIPGLRPKNVVPTTLDALCSRSNPVALPAARQSCQTTDLTALEVALFLSAYLHSTEDDAMDEIWSDCMAFFRDVLSNPLPYRQVLPALLSTILLIAQKVDNTNFGEQRKMRRDLGDIFLRTLTATFTAMPPGALEIQSPTGETANVNDQRSISLVVVLKQVIGNIEVILETSDRVLSAVNSISNSLISLVFHAKAFPSNVTPDFLALILQVAKKAPSAKSWKKELMDAFNDPRLLLSPTELVQNDWFPVLQQWCLYDKDRVPEILSRLTPPSSAGIMFGVGASAARLEADRRTQLNLRRLCLLLLACPEDTFVTMIQEIEEKLVELFDATPSSSPSSAVKAELFMVCRSLILSTSALHLAPLWPIMNSNMQSALMSLLSPSSGGNAFGNLSLLQACKLLDLLVAVSPDEFQLHEWLYITDTIDAVYQPSEWNSAALSDQVAEALTSNGTEELSSPVTPTTFPSNIAGRRRPLLDNSSLSGKEDIRAMARDDFARVILKPFLGHLSLHAYEGVYSVDTADISACRRNLLEDVLDLSSIVE